MSQLVTAAANDYTGIHANTVLVFTAGANGSRLHAIKCVAGGTNVVSVARFFINNGATNGTATNNTPCGQITLQSTAASAVAATAEFEYFIGRTLAPNERLYVGLATAVAAGWTFTAVASDL
jgi:hypothetical protein